MICRNGFDHPFFFFFFSTTVIMVNCSPQTPHQIKFILANEQNNLIWENASKDLKK